jgi:hypothetical protein
MWKKLLPKSPLGIALTAAAVILYASPEARKAVRKMAVKGLSTIMSLTDQIKESASSVKSELMENEQQETKSEDTPVIDSYKPFTYNVDIEPEDFLKGAQPVNVLNDEYLKKQAMEAPTNLN